MRLERETKAMLVKRIRTLDRENREMRRLIYGMTPESVPYTAERAIRPGETVFVMIPPRFIPR